MGRAHGLGWVDRAGPQLNVRDGLHRIQHGGEVVLVRAEVGFSLSDGVGEVDVCARPMRGEDETKIVCYGGVRGP